MASRNGISWTIRQAAPADADALLALSEIYLRELAARRGDSLQAGWQPRYRAFLDAILTQSDRLSLIAEHDGGIAGFLFAGAEAEPLFDGGAVGFIYDVFIQPEWRRAGMAAGLVHQAEAQLRGSGVRSISLQSLRDNVAANAFWERCGYRVTAWRYEKREV